MTNAQEKEEFELKGQLCARLSSKRKWKNTTEEQKEKQRKHAREFYHKNRKKILKRKKMIYKTIKNIQTKE